MWLRWVSNSRFNKSLFLRSFVTAGKLSRVPSKFSAYSFSEIYVCSLVTSNSHESVRLLSALHFSQCIVVPSTHFSYIINQRCNVN